MRRVPISKTLMNSLIIGAGDGQIDYLSFRVVVMAFHDLLGWAVSAALNPAIWGTLTPVDV
jgi:hypothetical protein